MKYSIKIILQQPVKGGLVMSERFDGIDAVG